MAITKEQVFAAADQIVAAGQRPTLEAVRKVIGGSYTTISPFVTEWKSRQGSTAPVSARDPLPQVVADRLAEVGADIWSVALGLANSRLASELESLEKARADMRAVQSEATELADELTARLVVLQSRLDASEVRFEEVDRRAADLRIELDRAHEALGQSREDVMKAREDATKAREEAARLAGQLAALQSQGSTSLPIPPISLKTSAKKRKAAVAVDGVDIV